MKRPSQPNTRAMRAKGTPFEILYRPKAKTKARKGASKGTPKAQPDQSYRARTLAALRDI